MNLDLFAEPEQSARQQLGPGAVLLRGHALLDAARLMAAVDTIVAAAPLRQMVTPGGYTMSVALTNCGTLGWSSDRRGYRYSAVDPLTGQPWPVLPTVFLQLAQAAARDAGFDGFVPDACLINRYAPGAKMGLHQDRDERDFGAPIVSVSLGLPAMFLFGGFERGDASVRVPLLHGDVLVWGGPDRLRYHGVLPVKAGQHAATGACRINLTLRQAG